MSAAFPCQQPPPRQPLEEVFVLQFSFGCRQLFLASNPLLGSLSKRFLFFNFPLDVGSFSLPAAPSSAASRRGFCSSIFLWMSAAFPCQQPPPRQPLEEVFVLQFSFG